jgi:PIN domain nuclease of toxin-antitoxin system
MKVLLDTHAFLWLITDEDRLSENARQTFLNTENSLFFSAASLWEICIKKSLGKLSLKDGWFQTIQKEMEINTIQWLPIETTHCAKVTELPFYHRDPFDRMLIAQAIVEEMKLLSRDSRLSDYAVELIW